MKDNYRELLIEWCDALVASQIAEGEHFGGFRCESCGFTHGRADNAVYPLVCAYDFTGDVKYLDAARNVLVFRKKLLQPSGAMQNDFTSAWEGITAFSAINHLKTLLFYGDILPSDLRAEIEGDAVTAVQWVHSHMVVGFHAYVNYYAAASLVNALADKYYHGAAYRARSKELLNYCLGLFTENGLLAGEGKPHDDRSPKGCLPIDIGYVAEESMPCLIHAAELLGDEEAIVTLTDHARKLLDFMLPDGGWDNSFGVRNNKWTYYGSRTSDGCIGAFAALSKRDDVFAEAAERTYKILKSCTHGGLLYGGVAYPENGQKPCIHHTICHAGALADALHTGIEERAARALPCDDKGISFKYYPEIDTYKIHAGKYLATLTGYDYATHHFANGAAHASGGALSLLYKQGTGAMIAGSVYRYVMTEPNNMQSPTGGKKHASLLVRAEYEEDGVRYATCLDLGAEIKVRGEKNAILANVIAKCVSEDGKGGKDVILSYRFAADGVTVKVGSAGENVRFILPIIENTGEILTTAPYTKEPVFFLTGGFAAEEYTFSLAEGVTITIR